MFSGSFSEGQERDINEGFPSDSEHYAEHYEYQSDSDLEDGSSCSEEEDGEPPEGKRRGDSLENAPYPKTSQTVVSDLPSPVETSEVQNDHRSTPFTIDCSPILVTPVADLTAISREWVKSPSSVTRRP